jgi:hypothetical protein
VGYFPQKFFARFFNPTAITMSMMHATTKRPLTLSEGRAALVESRTSKKPRADNNNDIDCDDFHFYKKGVWAWKLQELPVTSSYMMLNYSRRATKVYFSIISSI